jgi:ATP-dependent Lon protease
MPELTTETLPLLPLTSGVVLPGMVVTATLETPEARAAASAAGEAGGQLVLVPRVDGRYATVGTVAKIEDAGELPNGQLAVVVRGLHRARLGTGVAGTGEATWVQIAEAPEAPPTERAAQLAREYRAVVENILEARGARQVVETLRGITDPARWPTPPSTPPTSPSSARSRCWRPSTWRSAWRRSSAGRATPWPT